MSRCQRIVKPSRRPCIGDMRDEIRFRSRRLDAPVFDEVDFDETFGTTATVMSSVVTLPAGTTIFDGVNQDQVATHRVVARYDSSVTAETWIEVIESTKRLDILTTEDLEERHLWQIHMCTERGLAAVEATKA